MKIKTVKIEIASDDFDNIDMGLFIKSIRKQIKKIIKEEMSDNNVAVDIFEEKDFDDFKTPHSPHKYEEFQPPFKFEYDKKTSPYPPVYPVNPCAPPYVITCMDNAYDEQFTINNNILLK
jgi:hypothetical protein